MAQVSRKWIEDQAINNQKIDSSDTYEVDGLVVDSTSALGAIGIGTNSPQDAIHIRRTATMADFRLDLDDGGSGRSFQLNSDSAGRFNIYDVDAAATRVSVSNIGNVGIGTQSAATQLHIRSPLSDAGITLDLDDGGSGRSYQLLSNTSGEFQIYDADAAASRFEISGLGTVTIRGDATVDGNFQVDGTVTVLNTEIVITDQLEINQVANQPALIASQDAANSSVVVSVENVGSGPALTTTGVGNHAVGIGTTNPTGALEVYQTTGNPSINLTYNNNSATSSQFFFRKQRTAGIITTGDSLGGLFAFGHDGNDLSTEGARIEFVSNGTIATDRVPTDIRFYTHNDAVSTFSEKMRLTAAGFVGIGTTIPSSELTVAGDSASFEVRSDASTIGLISNVGGGVGVGQGLLQLYDQGVVTVRLTSSGDSYFLGGQIGIGTNAPANLMEIVGTDITDTELRITSSTTNSVNKSARISTQSYGSLEGVGLIYGSATNTSNSVIIGGGTNYDYAATDVKIHTAANTTTAIGTLRVHVTSGGLVGINTTPTGNNIIDSYAAGDTNILRLNTGSATSTGRSELGLWYNGTKYGEVYVTPTGAVVMGGFTGSTSTVLNVNGVNEMLLNASDITIPTNNLEVTAGNVGIGTTASTNLHVYDTGGIGNVPQVLLQTAGGVGSQALFTIDHGATNCFNILHQDDPGTPGNRFASIYTNNGGSLQFGTGLTGSTKMTISDSGLVGINTTPAGNNIIDSYGSGDSNIIRTNTGSASSTTISGLQMWVNGTHYGSVRAAGTGGVLIGGESGSSSTILRVNGTNAMELTSGLVGINTTPSGNYGLDAYNSGDTQKIRTNTGSAATTGSSGFECWYNGTKYTEMYVSGIGTSIIGGASGSTRTTLIVNGSTELTMDASLTEIPTNGLQISANNVGIGTAVNATYELDAYDSGDTALMRIASGSASTTANSGLEMWVGGAKSGHIYGTGLGGVVIAASTTGSAVYISGTLSKFAGSFLIDHPLDPKNKILRHSFVESPEMRNVYYGQATTVDGVATITLPDWWEALNGSDKSEFTYQFTSIGTYSRLYVSKEIEGNQFEVTSLDGDCKFSWTVSAVRHDKYAEENRIVVEEEKLEEQKGALLMDG